MVKISETLFLQNSILKVDLPHYRPFPDDWCQKNVNCVFLKKVKVKKNTYSTLFTHMCPIGAWACAPLCIIAIAPGPDLQPSVILSTIFNEKATLQHTRSQFQVYNDT